MPSYDYYCAANERTVEVMHAMSTTLRTWGEVCDLAGLACGQTPRDAKVEKMIGVGVVLNKPGAAAGTPMPRGGCGPGCGCHP